MRFLCVFLLYCFLGCIEGYYFNYFYFFFFIIYFFLLLGYGPLV